MLHGVVIGASPMRGLFRRRSVDELMHLTAAFIIVGYHVTIPIRSWVCHYSLCIHVYISVPGVIPYK